MGEAQDFTWLVERRSMVQQLLLELHQFVGRNRDQLLSHKEPWVLFGLLLGSTFALWRAVFLVKDARPIPAVLRDAERFLERLVRDNIINYSQEKETLVWAVGYYLNDAYYRLEQIRDVLHDPQHQRAFDASHRQWEEGIGETDPKIVWDTAYEAARAGFGILRQLAETEGKT